MSESEKIQTGYIGGNLRAEAGGTGGRREVGAIRCAETCHLCAEANTYGIAIRFLKVVQDIFVIFALGFGVLDGGVDTREDAEIIEALLYFGFLGRRKGIARLHREVLVD